MLSPPPQPNTKSLCSSSRVRLPRDRSLGDRLTLSFLASFVSVLIFDYLLTFDDEVDPQCPTGHSADNAPSQVTYIWSQRFNLVRLLRPFALLSKNRI